MIIGFEYINREGVLNVLHIKEDGEVFDADIGARSPEYEPPPPGMFALVVAVAQREMSVVVYRRIALLTEERLAPWELMEEFKKEPMTAYESFLPLVEEAMEDSPVREEEVDRVPGPFLN